MISGIYTGLLLVVFLAIVVWAWSRHNKTQFEEMSQMALKDDEQIQAETEENKP
jgi:cytochrome c oxidase cbb3-type subunit 4